MPELAPTLAPSLASVERASELRSAVRKFIGVRVFHSATADDLTQEVFLKVQAHVGQIRDPQRLSGWVIQIARNTIADYFRRRRATEPFHEENFEAPSPGSGLLELDESQLSEALSAYVRSVVEGLPPIYREALLMTDYQGISQVDLAERLGLTVSAAKSRVQRARATVRQTIERCCDFSTDRYGAVVDCTPKKSHCSCDVSGSAKIRASK